ncbi:unnamed protein product [Linum trigynum]|uniref:Uncharacterized protein n=1 Tax=Linum trigynum TaxID=586398 RepID=A0AAV2GA34_9ROSI
MHLPYGIHQLGDLGKSRCRPAISPAEKGNSLDIAMGLGQVKGLLIVLIRHFSLGHCSSDERPAQVMLYSLRTDTWRERVEIVRFLECYARLLSQHWGSISRTKFSICSALLLSGNSSCTRVPSLVLWWCLATLGFTSGLG